MTWLCGPQPVNVWLFHLPKQAWETPGYVMIGGATIDASCGASAFTRRRLTFQPCTALSSTLAAWCPICHPLCTIAVPIPAHKLRMGRLFGLTPADKMCMIHCFVDMGRKVMSGLVISSLLEVVFVFPRSAAG